MNKSRQTVAGIGDGKNPAGDIRIREIFAAVKADDVKTFSQIIEEKKSLLALCFGRFPLLSLCYLYKSRRIVKKFEKDLNAVSFFVYEDEEFEMYQRFRDSAKRSLRLYTGKDSLVTPLEMLAAIGDSEYLKEAYPRLNKTEKAKDSISKIYKKFYGRTVVQSKDAINTGGVQLPRFKRTCVLIMLIAALLMTVIPVTAWAVAKNSLGLGTEDSPVRISNAEQLALALKDNRHCVLAKNLTLPQDWAGGEFSGSLDGGGKTIYISGAPRGAFVSVLSGTISNIKFEFNEFEAEIAANTAFIVQTNNGTLHGVTVMLDADLSEAAENDISAACLVYENNGEISDCVLDARVSFAGDATGNTYLSGFCVLNRGMISDSYITEGSVFETDTVDVCGIAVENVREGTLSGCENNAEITQRSSNQNWLPNVAGIVLVNYGKVADCLNNGKITAISSAVLDSGQSVLEFYVGGIACINYDTIEKSKNTADISVESESFFVYAGGVAGLNETTAIVKNSCSYGRISVASTNTENIYLFAGGIAGFNAGGVVDSYSAAEFADSSENVFLGGISAVAYYRNGFTTYHSNNYYVNRSNIELSIPIYLAVAVNGNYFQRFNADAAGDTRVNSIEDLKTKEVYWG